MAMPPPCGVLAPATCGASIQSSFLARAMNGAIASLGAGTSNAQLVFTANADEKTREASRRKCLSEHRIELRHIRSCGPLHRLLAPAMTTLL